MSDNPIDEERLVREVIDEKTDQYGCLASGERTVDWTVRAVLRRLREEGHLPSHPSGEG